MAFDGHKNFAYAQIATAPAPATSGTSLIVTTGYGATLGTPPFNATVWATGVAPINSNAEIIRVTAISTDTLTIVRAQEGTTARTIVVGDQLAATVTAKSLTDIETQSAMQLSGTIDTFYQPNIYSQGNTSLLAVQNQTLDVLPLITSISQNGTIFTIVFASSILGSYGRLSDTFGMWTTGFTPSGWNLGNNLFPVTATILASDTTGKTVTIPSTATPTSVTVNGLAVAIPIQYTTYVNPLGLSFPRAIYEAEGVNTFKSSLSGLYGAGPVFQNTMNYTNGAPVTITAMTVTHNTTTLVKAGDQRAGLTPGLKVVGASIADGTTLTNAAYDGTNTTLTISANFTGTTGTEDVVFVADIATAEGFVNTPLAIASGSSVVSFPLQSTTFGAPGEGQGWQIGFWDGPLFYGNLENINSVNYIANGFHLLGSNTIERIAFAANDAKSKRTASGGGTVQVQYGVAIGALGGVRTTFTPLLGGEVNVGLINNSTTIFPSAPPITYISSSIWIPPLGYGTTSVGVTSVSNFPTIGNLQGITPGTNPGHYTLIAYTGVSGGNTFTGCSAPTPGAFTTVTVASNSLNASTTITRVSAGSYISDGIKIGMFIIDNTSGARISGNTQVTAVAATTLTLSQVAAGTAGTDSLTFALGTNLIALEAVLGGNTFQTVAAGFTVQGYGTSASLVASSSVSAVTGSVVIVGGVSTFDGQLLFINNDSAVGVNLSFTSGGGSGLALGAPIRVLGPNAVLSLMYDSSTSLWDEIAFSSGGITQPVRSTVISGSAATCTPTADASDIYSFTTSAGGALTIASPTGTPTEGQKLQLRIKNTGAAPTYTWNIIYRASSNLALPTAATASKWDYCGFEYNAVDSKWDFVALNQAF